MKKIQRSDQTEWRHIQIKTRDSVDMLAMITDHLQIRGLAKTPGEVKKYLNYSSSLTKLMAKIDHIIATLEADIPGMMETLIDQYIKEGRRRLLRQSYKSNVKNIKIKLLHLWSYSYSSAGPATSSR
jgi:hypothetical protein